MREAVVKSFLCLAVTVALWYKLYIRETQEKVIPGSFYASRLVNLPLIGRKQTESGRRKKLDYFVSVSLSLWTLFQKSFFQNKKVQWLLKETVHGMEDLHHFF